MTHVLILLCFLGQATKTDLTETEVIIIGVICAVILLSLIIVLIVIICRRRTNGMVFLWNFLSINVLFILKSFVLQNLVVKDRYLYRNAAVCRQNLTVYLQFFVGT